MVLTTQRNKGVPVGLIVVIVLILPLTGRI